MEKIKSIIEQINIINKKYNEIDKITGRNFNIFDAANIGHREIIHTQLLSELLSPNGSHNQKDKFLKIFLDILGLNFKLKNPKCYPEYIIDNNRRIDILIDDNDFIIAIEAKIFAKDSDNQLKDYYDFLNKNKKESKLFYLTLNGNLPSENSLNDLSNNDIIIISFKNEIYKWITECIKEVSDIPIIRDGLYQYELLLERLTNKNKKKEEEVKEVISKDSESIKAADEIFKNYEDVWYEKEEEFWVELYNYARKYFQDWEDGDSDIYNVWYDENGNEFDDDAVLNNLKTHNNEVRGICFKKIINKQTIYIGIDYSNYDETISIWYSGINKQLNGFEFIKKDDENINFYTTYANTELSFYPNDNLSFEIFDKAKFNEIIKKLSKELNDLKNELLN